MLMGVFKIWKSVTVSGGDIGFRLLSEGTDGSVGSVSFVDSSFEGVKTAILIPPPAEADPRT